MVASYESCMLAVLSTPEDDSARLELADCLRSTDPDRADFIERQVEMAKLLRTTKYKPRVARVGSLSIEEDRLLSAHRQEWTRDLAFFMGELPIHQHVEFHRGLPWLCSMNPYVFLEQGEYIFNRIAPLRGVEFFPDPEGAPFPTEKIAASPLLERLDEIRFYEFTLKPADLEVLASSRYLKRLLSLDVRRNNATLPAFEALAANPDTRKVLSIESFDYMGIANQVRSDNGPIGEFDAKDDWGWYRFEMSAEGHELERKYGYIPWLHQANSGFAGPDAHYFVENKVLPLFVPGSAADAPTPYGSGLGPAKALRPRSEAAGFIY